jgi:hypothetical protein
MGTLADAMLNMNRLLRLEAQLPLGYSILNPFHGPDADVVWRINTAFYKRFYDDDAPRRLILGINPGRLGAGLTGIPFTDTRRLTEDCHIPCPELHSHEPSSVFVYRVIRAMGGPEVFYGRFLISSVCPLGLLFDKGNGRPVNANYYDSSALTSALLPFIEHSLRSHAAMGLRTDVVYCFGTGDNFRALSAINQRNGLFGRIVPLEHPRYIMQYRAKDADAYVSRFMEALGH